ncbi:MAG: ABC transporter substrate-binding protein [Cellulosilyticaceae bacterium]
MKKIWKSIMVLGMTLALAGCSGQAAATAEPIHVAALNGPTGMGIVKLIDETDRYDVALYQNPDEIVGKVVSGEVDVACVPSNMAAVLYNKTKGTDAEIGLLGINTWGVLYLVENNAGVSELEDLKGKTVLASGKGSTPEFVLTEILAQNGLKLGEDVKVEYLANHADIASTLASQEGAVALLPQPFVTTVLAKNPKVTVAMDLNTIWEDMTRSKLPMGTMIANKAYVEANKQVIDDFIKDYTKSVRFVNEEVDAAAELIAKHQIIPSVELAKKAIPECHIAWSPAPWAKDSLQPFYEVLKAQEPKAVGGQLPDEAFYDWR